MENQNYCMVNEQSEICENVVVWDGDTDTWTPPAGYLMLVQATTPAKNWTWDVALDDWVLSVTGVGEIGFTWDGTYFTTDQPKPELQVQAVVEGAQQL